LNSQLSDLQPVTSPSEIIQMQDERRNIKVEDSVRDYIVRIARATREHSEIQLGASPRATIAIYHSAQAWAAIQGRDFILPDDIKYIAPHVLTHRLIVSSQAQLRGRLPSQLVSDIVDSISVPVEN
jgi:MoxR-like ATPase